MNKKLTFEQADRKSTRLNLKIHNFRSKKVLIATQRLANYLLFVCRNFRKAKAKLKILIQS